jgi:plasmid stabilization system protein ParE
MKRYRVEFSDESKQDIAKSFKWGCKVWGEAAALRWYRTIKSKTRDILKQFPLSQPIAPESDDSDREIRQMTFGRYRILFEVEELTVRILHVRGSFVSEDRDDLGIEE